MPRITLNGETMTTHAKTLAELVSALHASETRVATALNGVFVSTPARNLTPLAPGDSVEILTARQGG